jgi:hypothetical protein
MHSIAMEATMEPVDNDVRELAKRRVRRARARTGFLVHMMMYAIVNAGLILIWSLSETTYPWFIWPLFGWGIGLASHTVAFVFGPDSTHEARALEREILRLRPRNQG